MSERPTPETDDAQWGTGKVTTDFARRLERERDEAREKAERYRLEANAMMLQRDEAREEVARLRESFRCLLNPQCAVEEAAK